MDNILEKMAEQEAEKWAKLRNDYVVMTHEISVLDSVIFDIRLRIAKIEASKKSLGIKLQNFEDKYGK